MEITAMVLEAVVVGLRRMACQLGSAKKGLTRRSELRNMNPMQLENWHARARSVAARLSALGIPARVEAKYEGPDCVELNFQPSPLANIALMEILADDLERNLRNGGSTPEAN